MVPTMVWLPEPPDTLPGGGLPDGMVADVWTGGETLPDSAEKVEVIVMPFRSTPAMTAKVARLPNLKLIQLRSAGAEAVIPYVPDGVTVCNARGAHDPATAEWVVGAIFVQSRNLSRFVRAQKAGMWDPVVSEPVAGKHVLIVGYGSIGAAVERRLAGWEVTVERIARRARPGDPGSPGDPDANPPVEGIDSLYDALPRADVVVLLLPVTEQTTNLVDAEFLAAMKDGALLVNAARGPIVDTLALLRELNEGRLKAALDVTDPEPLPAGHPLWRAPNVLLTPHVGGMVRTAGSRAAAVVRDQLARYAAGEPLENVIGPQGY